MTIPIAKADRKLDHDALDRLDLRILAELQADGRIANLKLAESIGLSPPAVLARFLSDTGSLADDLTVMRTSDSPRLALESIRATPLLLRGRR